MKVTDDVGWVLALLMCELVASCGTTHRVTEQPAQWSVQRGPDESVAILDAELTLEGKLVPLGARKEALIALPVEVRLERDAIVCSRLVEGDPIHFLTYECEGDRSAYGVYGLWKAKNHLPADYPLSGNPIAWNDRNSAQALSHWLESDGVSTATAAWLVANSNWLSEGLRVFFTVPRESAGDFDEENLAPLLLIRVEIPSEVRSLALVGSL